MNNIELLKNMLHSKNPQQLVMNLMSKSNPMIGNLIEMANNGNNKGVETFARNICKEKNIDFDKSFNEFVKQLKG